MAPKLVDKNKIVGSLLGRWNWEIIKKKELIFMLVLGKLASLFFQKAKWGSLSIQLADHLDI